MKNMDKTMKIQTQRLFYIFFVLSIVFLITACSDPSTTNYYEETIITRVTINPEYVFVPRGGTQKFTATVAGTNNPPQDVTWSLSRSEWNAGTYISSDGILTVAVNETITYLSVQATSNSNHNIYALATVYFDTPTINEVKVNPSSASILLGGTQNFTASVIGTYNPPQDVTWTIIRSGSNAGTTISSDGVLKIAANETVSSLSVRATSTFNTNMYGEATITVLHPTVSSITVSPSSVSVARGGTQNFSATVLGTNNPPQGVTWEISGSSGWQTSSITSDGVLTIGPNENSEYFNVIAKSIFNTNIVGYAYVTVLLPIVTGVTVSPSTVTLPRGGTQNFTATVLGTNNPPQGVTWRIWGASDSYINSSGGLTVGLNEYYTTITVEATSTANTKISGEATVTILIPTVTGVTVNPATVTLLRGGSQNFTATVHGTNDPPQDVTWFCSSGGTINSSGGLTVGASTSGTITVQATSIFSPSQWGEATVTVPRPRITGVTISPPSATVSKGGTQIFTAKVFGENFPGGIVPQDVTWLIPDYWGYSYITSTGILVVSEYESSSTLIVRAATEYEGYGEAGVIIPQP